MDFLINFQTKNEPHFTRNVYVPGFTNHMQIRKYQLRMSIKNVVSSVNRNVFTILWRAVPGKRKAGDKEEENKDKKLKAWREYEGKKMIGPVKVMQVQ